MAKAPESSSKSFLFRDLDSNLRIGMASDRYAGWIGQIYSEGRYQKGITRRSHKVGDKTFNEETLPVESVSEYFEHFPLLEIDYTFYRLLLEKDGKPTPNFHVLKSYRQHMKDGNLLLLKVPQVIIARKLRRGAGLSRMIPANSFIGAKFLSPMASTYLLWLLALFTPEHMRRALTYLGVDFS
jgi:hypothetical protein